MRGRSPDLSPQDLYNFILQGHMRIGVALERAGVSFDEQIEALDEWPTDDPNLQWYFDQLRACMTAATQSEGAHRRSQMTVIEGGKNQDGDEEPGAA
jgi:hypothetical protein